MKVLIIHTKYKQKGGEDAVVVEETALLQSRGVEVEVLEYSNDGKTMFKFLQLPFNISSYLRAKKILKTFNPDIVHIHNLHFAASASVLYAIKSQNKPCVFTVHNYRLLCPSATLFNNQKHFFQSLRGGFPWAAVFKGVYNDSKVLTFWLGFSMWLHNLIGTWKIVNRFILLTDHSRDILQLSHLKFVTEKITIKPNFAADNTLTDVTRENHFLYVGRLSNEKGIRVMLDAFENSPYSLRIIGDGPLKNEVLAYANRLDNITYAGLQNKQTIAGEMRKCTALIFPSVWNETFGLTIIEAYAASTPVIASNIGAASILIEHETTGLHFEAANKEQLKSRLKQWQELNEQKKAQYRLNARRTYELKYTGDKNFTQLISIYNAVLNRMTA